MLLFGCSFRAASHDWRPHSNPADSLRRLTPAWSSMMTTRGNQAPKNGLPTGFE